MPTPTIGTGSSVQANNTDGKAGTGGRSLWPNATVAASARSATANGRLMSTRLIGWWCGAGRNMQAFSPASGIHRSRGDVPQSASLEYGACRLRLEEAPADHPSQGAPAIGGDDRQPESCNREPRDELMRRLAASPGLRTLFRSAVPLLVMLLLGGCLFPPTPETTQAKDVFTLYVVVFIMGAVVFFGVEGAIVYSVIRYRRRDDRLPDQLHGHTLVEIVWTAIPTVIVLFLFVWATLTLTTIQAKSDPAVTIEVTGFQWQWTFHYLDGDTDPNNDYRVTGTPANPPVMGLPTGEPVRLILKSSDVIH